MFSGQPAFCGSACRTSPIEFSPRRSMSRRSSTMTGATASDRSSHKREPLTVTSSNESFGEGRPDRLSASAAAPKGGPTQPDGEAQLDTAKILTVRSFSNSKCSPVDRKSTRLNSSHSQISYAVFCLKKKKKKKKKKDT